MKLLCYSTTWLWIFSGATIGSRAQTAAPPPMAAYQTLPITLLSSESERSSKTCVLHPAKPIRLFDSFHLTYLIEFRVSCMWFLINASSCSSLPSSGYRGRPLREPCGSPTSTVLWIRKTALLPLPAPPVSLGSRRLRLRVVRFSRGSPLPRRPGAFGLGVTCCPYNGEAESSPGFMGNPS